MQRVVLWIVLLGLGLPALGAYQEGSIYLPLVNVFERIESQNLDVLLSKETVQQAFQDSIIERANLLPSVKLQGKQSKSRSLDSNRSRKRSKSFTGSFVGSFKVLDFPGIAKYKLSKDTWKLSQLDHKELLEQVLFEAGNAYFLYIRSLGALRVAESNIRRDESFLELTQARMEMGDGSALDVTRAEVRLAQDRKQWLEQKSVVYEKQLDLRTILDMNLSPSLDVIVDEEVYAQKPVEVVLSREELFAMNPEHQRAKRNLKRSEFDYKSSRWDRLPSVSLDGDAGVSASRANETHKQTVWSVGVTVSMPIFDPGGISAKRMKKASELRGNRYALRDTAKQVESSYLLFGERINSRAEQIEIAKKEVLLSQTELELVSIQFESGVASSQDVLDARSNLQQAEDGLVDAYYRFHVSLLEMGKVLGNTRWILDYYEA